MLPWSIFAFDDGVEPLRHDTIWFLHLRNLRQYVALPILLGARARLQLLGALFHRGPFLFRESTGSFLHARLHHFPISHWELLLTAV